MKFNDTFIKILSIDMTKGNTPFLAGPPGIGKSSIVRSLAEATGGEVFVVMCNQMADKGDLTGVRLMETDDGSYEQRFFPHYKVRQAIKTAEANPRDWVYLLLDEINRTTPDVTSAALTLSTERELGDMQLPDNVKIIVAGNLHGNVNALDDASLSRFSVYHVMAEADSFIAYHDSQPEKLNPWVRNVLTKHPHLIFEKAAPAPMNEAEDEDGLMSVNDLDDSADDILQLTTPRTINYASKWLNEAEPDFLNELLQTETSVNGREITMLAEVMESKLGNTDFTTFLIDEIVTGLNSGTSQASPSITVPKPNCYASLKSAQTMTDLDDTIAQLTDKEKSGALLYALYEQADNSHVIAQLAAAGTSMEVEHNKKLVEIAMNGKIDGDNLQALYASGAPVGSMVQSMLQHIGY